MADTAVADSSYDGLCSVTGSVESLTAKVLSYGVTASSYIPRAAHGMYTTFYINYDAVSGKVFTVGDLFTKDGLEKLPETLKSAAADMRGFIGPTEIDGIPHGGNFCISADGDTINRRKPNVLTNDGIGRWGEYFANSLSYILPRGHALPHHHRPRLMAKATGAIMQTSASSPITGKKNPITRYASRIQ